MKKALFTNIDEVKEYMAVSLATDMTTILPDIRWAERQYIKPALGSTLYDTLKSEYNNDNLTNDNEDLLPYVQEPLINLAYVHYIDEGQLDISDRGIHIHTDDQTKTAFPWQIANLKNKYKERGFDALEELLEFLEKNATQSKYNSWLSEAASQTKQFFINTADEFNKWVDIGNSRRTFMALWPTMRRVEEEEIKAYMGGKFFDEFRKAFRNDNLNSEEEKLLPYIRPALANMTIAEAIAKLPLNFQEDSIRLVEYDQDDKQEKSASKEMLMQAKHEYKQGARSDLEKLQRYLDDNASNAIYKTYYDNKPSAESVDLNSDTSSATYNGLM